MRKHINLRRIITGRSGSICTVALLAAGMAGPAWAVGFVGPVVQASHVEGSISAVGGGAPAEAEKLEYAYTVYNDGSLGLDDGDLSVDPVIRDWELPWFGDAGIKDTDIFSPDGWAYAIETIGVADGATGWDGVASWQDPGDPFYQGPNSPYTSVTEVLHWYTNDAENFGIRTISSGIKSLGGFGFTADYAPTAAPYQASWVVLPSQSGDPAFPLGGIPASPGTQQQVPEPGSVALLALGLFALLFALRRRKKAGHSR